MLSSLRPGGWRVAGREMGSWNAQRPPENALEVITTKCTKSTKDGTSRQVEKIRSSVLSMFEDELRNALRNLRVLRVLRGDFFTGHGRAALSHYSGSTVVCLTSVSAIDDVIDCTFGSFDRWSRKNCS